MLLDFLSLPISVILIHFKVNRNFGSVFMAIEMTVDPTISFEKGWGKLL